MNMKYFFKRKGPFILAVFATVGTVATAVSAARASTRAAELIEAKEKEKGEVLTRAEIVRTAAPVYIPAVVLGFSTVCCIFGINALNKHRQAAITGAYALINESYNRYRQAAKKVYGDEADSKITAQMAEDRYIYSSGIFSSGAVYDPTHDRSEKILFYDNFSNGLGKYFTSTMAAVINAQYHLLRNLCMRGYATVNEFYNFLGLEEVVGGDEIGWRMDSLMEDGCMWLDFENEFTRLDDGLECYIISPMFDPEILWSED